MKKAFSNGVEVAGIDGHQLSKSDHFNIKKSKKVSLADAALSIVFRSIAKANTNLTKLARMLLGVFSYFENS